MVFFAATQSVCPVCLKTLPAELRQEGDCVRIHRTCPEHGVFSGLVWKGGPSLAAWQRDKAPVPGVRRETPGGRGCPHDCGRCPEHEQHACTVLFEITKRCNLACPVCFADSGGGAEPFAPLDGLVRELGWIREHAGNVVLQLSGGEPTLHPDLPALTREARRLFPAVQLNTNGLLLAERPGLARNLAEAGLSWVFLQFDGTSDASCTALRGRPLIEKKLEAVRNCGKAGLSVVLVPTIAKGVNDGELGDLLRLALSLTPTVRGMHLQPMTSSGRNGLAPAPGEPLTLPEVLRRLSEQSGGLVLPEHAAAPNCEHSRCSFHCRYRLTASGSLLPLRGESPCCGESAPCCPPRSMGPDGRPSDRPGDRSDDRPGNGGARRAIDVILRAWQGAGADEAATGDGPAPGKKAGPGNKAGKGEKEPGPVDALDAFIAEARERTFSLTCMAFQDCMNLDLARLRHCCVHVFAGPDRLVPFCAYNLTALDGAPLYRK